MKNEKAILVEGLEKSYREGFLMKKSKVLHELSFSVGVGQIFGFLGANGAGKTTTIKILLGLQAADQGRVDLLGQPPADVKSRERIGYLPERPYFQSNLTADEFLDFNRGLFSSSRQRAGKLTNQQLFELVGLPGIGHHVLRSFSKGMLQRIGIAQSLVNDPELVILDEPMSGLDPVGRKEVRNMIVDLNRRGKTVFFSTHILSDVELLCSEIAFLEKGHLKYCGRIDEIIGTKSQEYEVVFRGSGELAALLQRFGSVQSVGGRQRLLVEGTNLAKEVAEICWSQGAEVLSLSPVQKSLEEALFGKGSMS